MNVRLTEEQVAERRRKKNVRNLILVGAALLIGLCGLSWWSLGLFSPAKNTLLLKNSDLRPSALEPDAAPTSLAVMPVVTRVTQDNGVVRAEVEQILKTRTVLVDFRETARNDYKVQASTLDRTTLDLLFTQVSLPDTTADYEFHGYIVAGVNMAKRKATVTEQDGKIIVLITLPAANIEHVVVDGKDVQMLKDGRWIRIINPSAESFQLAGSVVESTMRAKACKDQILTIASQQAVQVVAEDYAFLKEKYQNVEIQVAIVAPAGC